MNPATQIVHWPGNDVAACDDHLKKLVGLGAILGIQISWTPCDETVCSNCYSEHACETCGFRGKYCTCADAPTKPKEARNGEEQAGTTQL